MSIYTFAQNLEVSSVDRSVAGVSIAGLCFLNDPDSKLVVLK